MTEAIAKAISAIPPPIVRTKLLTVEELKTLQLPLKIQGNLVTVEEGLRGGKLKQPISLDLNKVLAAKEKGLVAYIFSAFLSERPGLLPFVFDNQTIIKLARHLLRHCSGSPNTCCSYMVQVRRYSTWLGYSPDLIIQDLKPVGNIPDPQRIQNHTGYLNDYLAQLQDDGLNPSRNESSTKTEHQNPKNYPNCST
jgi:hypothetical protein